MDCVRPCKAEGHTRCPFKLIGVFSMNECFNWWPGFQGLLAEQENVSKPIWDPHWPPLKMHNYDKEHVFWGRKQSGAWTQIFGEMKCGQMCHLMIFLMSFNGLSLVLSSHNENLCLQSLCFHSPLYALCTTRVPGKTAINLNGMSPELQPESMGRWLTIHSLWGCEGKSCCPIVLAVHCWSPPLLPGKREEVHWILCVGGHLWPVSPHRNCRLCVNPTSLFCTPFLLDFARHFCFAKTCLDTAKLGTKADRIKPKQVKWQSFCLLENKQPTPSKCLHRSTKARNVLPFCVTMFTHLCDESQTRTNTHRQQKDSYSSEITCSAYIESAQTVHKRCKLWQQQWRQKETKGIAVGMTY